MLPQAAVAPVVKLMKAPRHQTGHIGSVSCLALCGEFILSGSQGKDIIVWQQPDLRQFTKFGQGDGSVKALASIGNKVFTAHQDSRIRVWKVSRSSENIFRLVDTLPTTKDYLGKFMKQSNYVQIRRHHKRLWIEHADSISCLAVHNGLIYSGSWDKTLKVWRISDFKCLESIKAHDDAINGLVSSKRIIYSASADGKIKAWEKEGKSTHSLKGILEGHKDVSVNSVAVSEDGSLVYGGGSDGYVLGWLGNKLFDSWRVICEVKILRFVVNDQLITVFTEDDCTMIVNHRPKEESDRKSLASPRHVADIVSVSWVSKDKSVMGMNLPETSVMMAKEMIRGGYEIGKGLGHNLQRILEPIEFQGKNDTFGLEFQPTSRDKKEMLDHKRAEMEGKQIIRNIPPLHYTFPYPSEVIGFELDPIDEMDQLV
ncbi:protein JINGUBANG-like [Coffea eugenioides]|uniref:protein JINGUBANG-like n=1 Tax=Coffea eugenioides TaxID=49369 RepID=UPI000F614D3C|nr:protein JINGUBANG-like [Coffea eugenioides]